MVLFSPLRRFDTGSSVDCDVASRRRSLSQTLLLIGTAAYAGLVLLLMSAPAAAQPLSTDSTRTNGKRAVDVPRGSLADPSGAEASKPSPSGRQVGKTVRMFSKAAAPVASNVVQRPPDIDSLAQQTSFAIAAENYDVVAQNLEIITAYREDDAGLHVLLARAYTQLKQYDKAIEAQRTAIRLGADTVDARFRLAVLLTQNGQREESLDLLRSLLQTHADRPEIRMRYAETLIEVGRVKTGTEEVETMIKMYPDEPSVRMSAVEAMWKAGRRDRAFEMAVSNIEAFPQAPLMHGQIADLYLRTEQWEKAKASLLTMKEWIRREKSWANIIYNANLGYLYARSGRAEEGREMIQKSLDASENNPYALRNLGVAYLNLGQTERACDAFQLAVDRKYDGAFHKSMQFGRHPQVLLNRHCPNSEKRPTGNDASSSME